MDILLSLLGEEIFFNYMAYRLHVMLPLFSSMLYIILNVRAELRFRQKYIIHYVESIKRERTEQWIIPILRWRTRSLAKVADETPCLSQFLYA